MNFILYVEQTLGEAWFLLWTEKMATEVELKWQNIEMTDGNCYLKKIKPYSDIQFTSREKVSNNESIQTKIY